MNKLGKFFLRAESWQVFAVVVGACAIGDMAFLRSVTLASNERVSASIQLLGIFAALCDSVGFIWLWLLGVELNDLTRLNREWSVKLFFVAIAVSEIYLIVLFVFALNTRVMNSIGPLVVFATVCIFYVVRFVAKTLVLAETGKVPRFRDYVVPFLLFCFFPFGIWLLQPRINQLYAEKGEGG